MAQRRLFGFRRRFMKVAAYFIDTFKWIWETGNTERNQNKRQSITINQVAALSIIRVGLSTVRFFGNYDNTMVVRILYVNISNYGEANMWIRW